MKKRHFILASIFLFNPIISVFDIFPDVIGYFLIMKAFSKASYVYDNADETRQLFKTMSLISIFKLICLIILPFTDATMALVFSFTFAIIEFIFGISAFRHMFDTVSYIYLRLGEDASIPRCEKLKRFTILFFIIRIACSTIPDLFALFLSDPQKSWMFRFRMLFFFLLTIVALVFGIVWLCRMISFFKVTLTDNVKEKIEADFTETMKDRQSVFFSKDFILAISTISISMLFTIDLYIDKFDYLSDLFIAPMLLITFVFLIKKGHISLAKQERLLIALICTHFVSSILNIVFTTRYDDEYLKSSALRSEGALKMYIPVVIFSVLTAILMTFIIVIIMRQLNKYTLKRIYENPRFFSEYSVEGFVKEFSAEINKKMRLSLVLTVLSGVSSVLYPFVIPYKEEYVVFDNFIAIIFCVSFMYMLSYINDTIYRKILKYS